MVSPVDPPAHADADASPVVGRWSAAGRGFVSLRNRDFRYLTELGRLELVLAVYREVRPACPDPEVLAFCYYREALLDTAWLACGISQRDVTDEEDARDLGFLENMCDWAGTDRLRDWAADLRRIL